MRFFTILKHSISFVVAATLIGSCNFEGDKDTRVSTIGEGDAREVASGGLELTQPEVDASINAKEISIEVFKVAACEVKEIGDGQPSQDRDTLENQSEGSLDLSDAAAIPDTIADTVETSVDVPVGPSDSPVMTSRPCRPEELNAEKHLRKVFSVKKAYKQGALTRVGPLEAGEYMVRIDVINDKGEIVLRGEEITAVDSAGKGRVNVNLKKYVNDDGLIISTTVDNQDIPTEDMICKKMSGNVYSKRTKKCLVYVDSCELSALVAESYAIDRGLMCKTIPVGEVCGAVFGYLVAPKTQKCESFVNSCEGSKMRSQGYALPSPGQCGGFEKEVEIPGFDEAPGEIRKIVVKKGEVFAIPLMLGTTEFTILRDTKTSTLNVLGRREDVSADKRVSIYQLLRATRQGIYVVRIKDVPVRNNLPNVIASQNTEASFRYYVITSQ